jgi:L-amino acid N-acyltransferase
MNEPVTVRPARSGDLARILEIYNHEVAFSTATYDTEPRSMAEQEKWFSHHDATHPVLVAEGGGRVLGWASLSPWAERAAYNSSVEVSVYVADEARRRGIGRLLLRALIEAGKIHGFHALLARISADNEASIRLHATLGFTTVGMLKEVGIKFGQMLDVAIMELVV